MPPLLRSIFRPALSLPLQPRPMQNSAWPAGLQRENFLPGLLSRPPFGEACGARVPISVTFGHPAPRTNPPNPCWSSKSRRRADTPRAILPTKHDIDNVPEESLLEESYY